MSNEGNDPAAPPVALFYQGTPLVRVVPTAAALLRYDPEADAAYLYLKAIAPGEVKRTVFVEKLNNDVALDLDADGRVVGIEFLDPTRLLPAELLARAELIGVPESR